ncbi:MAG: cytochrome c peroxidase [Salibacteraceae bacterium]|jgi:cytochrome c peroxidase
MQVFRFTFLFFVFGFFLSSCAIEPVECTEGPEAPEKVIPYELEFPIGFPVFGVPEDNPMTVQGVELGRKLFYDTRLSGDNTQACATCHISQASYSDSNRYSTGIDGSIGDRNAMAIVNLGYSFAYFWDGRSTTLEIQALDPVTNPMEMNANWTDVLVSLNEDVYYRQKFKVAFDVDVIDSLDVGKALAQFERTMMSGNSKFDRSRQGGETLTPSETRGQLIYTTERADCFHCHGTTLLMGFTYENNGLQQTLLDQGRGGVTGNPFDVAKFKPPTLRNIALTGPYMHDGRFQTLKEVIEFYNSGVNQSSPNVSPLMLKSNRPGGSLNLSQEEKDDLLAFLLTLTDTEFITNPAFMAP